MATKKRKSSAAKKSSLRTSTAKKATTRKAAAKKAGARKSAVKKAGARKSAAKKARAKKAAPATRTSAVKKAGARKTAAKKTGASATKRGTTRKAPAAKKSTRTAGPSSPRLAVARETPDVELSSVSWESRPVTGDPDLEQVETTSAGLQPLAPEHAAVDELTSSGNELLDIFQRYDRNRTGSIERAEFARLLEALGQNVTDEELEIALDIVDTDSTGKISWIEFKTWWTSR
ncbi:EF-hand domain-containing protein [Myxococcus sp. K15C18031901]|uniref:EF-hand domain-containing protein n=1 Tax=Myxococcus dinghuensis TaxID=2906761 RepID=UPI0020A78352|nr:EF-hand domain-containing protein [Myxococcus dinghuensis]MCP3097478.1 EF-hand domain-containing protein [Myxococcus dinghuensis]